jgi:NADH-quinone oxidoreductase subunit J
LLHAHGSSNPRKSACRSPLAVFYLLAAITVASALGVALSRSIVYSAFSLMGALLGVAAMFVLLGADFLGVVQLLVYVGGILVLTLFAVMLTHRISDVNVSNRAVGRGAGSSSSGSSRSGCCRWRGSGLGGEGPAEAAPTTYGIGNAFLTDFVLPFEVASIVLLAALVGAIVVSRKEVKA